MKTYTIEETTTALSDVGLKAGDTVLVHSSLFSLGRLDCSPISETPRRIAEALLNYLGSDGTLIVPTFNFGFGKGPAFDRQHTNCAEMGVLAEYIRQDPRSVRSYHPLQSFSAIGRHAKEICLRDTPSSFDKDGPVAEMIKRNANLLLLGAPMQSASLVHFLEESFQVPYRYWKTFSGPYIDNGTTATKTYKMYVRDLALNPRLRLAYIEEWLTAAQQISSVKLGAGVIKMCSFNSFLDLTSQRLREDPLCLISH